MFSILFHMPRRMSRVFHLPARLNNLRKCFEKNITKQKLQEKISPGIFTAIVCQQPLSVRLAVGRGLLSHTFYRFILNISFYVPTFVVFSINTVTVSLPLNIAYRIGYIFHHCAGAVQYAWRFDLFGAGLYVPNKRIFGLFSYKNFASSSDKLPKVILLRFYFETAII